MGKEPDTEGDKNQEETTDSGSDDGKINDPLTRDVEAPRAEFEGRPPEEE